MKPLKILVVEDQLLTAERIRETLEGAGYEVIALARSYEEALVAAVKSRPDLMIMDIELDGSDGIHATHDIRNVFRVPVVFLTGKEDAETFARASETQPEGYLLKPFKPRDLIHQVDLAYSRSARRAATPDDVFVWDNGSHIRIRRNEVILMEAQRVFTSIYSTGSSEPLIVTMNLGHISKYFPEPHFYRLSKSLVVNLHFLEKVKENELFFEGMKKTMTISEPKKSELKKQLHIIRSPRATKTDVV